MSSEATSLAEPTNGVLDIIRAAVDNKFDAGQLKVLFDLQCAHHANQAREAYSQAMNRLQDKVPLILETKKGQNSKYAPLENIHAALKPVYVAEGFSISYGTDTSAREGFVRVVADVLHKAGHERRYYMDMPLDGIGPKGNPIGGMNGPQAMGSTYSYARRYLLCLIFNITLAGEDNDAASLMQRVGPEEIKTINALFEQCRNAGKPVNVPLFLKWLTPRGQQEPMESLEFLLLRDFTKACNELLRKLAEPAKKKGEST